MSFFYAFSIKTSKCSGSCNNINDPYAKICAPDAVKDFNVDVFNLMSRTNETGHMKWHKTCKCKCILDESVCNKKTTLERCKCWCKCKEWIDKAINAINDKCDKGYAWNPRNCECECDKSCDVGEYLDYEKLTKIAFFKHKNECACYYTVFIVLALIALAISIGIGAYFVYYKYMNCNKENVSVYDYVHHAKNY